MSVEVNKLMEDASDIQNILASMADGDFTASTNANYIGQFAPIKTSIIQINDKLSDTLANISYAAKEVNGGAEGIASGATEIAQGAQEQNNIIQAFVEITKNISANINATISKVDESTIITNDAKSKAGQGTQAMESM